MRSLLYALLLLAVLVASIYLLHTVEEQPAGTSTSRPEPVISSDAPQPIFLDSSELEGASATELYMIGDELLRLWHVREATAVFEQALRADSTHYGVLVKLVECCSHALICREDDAREFHRRAEQLLPAPEDSLFLQGLRDLYIDRHYDSAVLRFKAARRVEVSHSDASYYLGMAHLQSGHPLQSLTIAEELLGADPTESRALELSIRSLVAAGKIEDAAAQAKDLARQYAEEPFPYVLLALVELTRGHQEQAVQFCNNALVLDPRYIPAIVARANLYVRAGDIDAGRVSFEKLLLFDDPVLRAIGHEGVAFASFIAGDFPRGVDAMDEAVRNAMLPGAVRRGLSYASRLVDYLCELGEARAAEEVVDRWVKGFGRIPEVLGRLRIEVLAGDYDHVRKTLIRMETDKDWLVWSQVLAIDTGELTALTEIGEGKSAKAAATLATDKQGRVAMGAAVASRRAFLRGYALFESGDAEAAREAFAGARSSFYTIEFPYRGDPVLYVQALFYMAECALAAGSADEAIAGYRAFLDVWGDTHWELRAVGRAQQKLKSLEGSVPAQEPQEDETP